jgi:hypothetical protein
MQMFSMSATYELRQHVHFCLYVVVDMETKEWFFLEKREDYYIVCWLWQRDHFIDRVEECQRGEKRQVNPIRVPHNTIQ